jgi:hypothetical protein
MLDQEVYGFGTIKNSRQNFIILFWKHLVDITKEALLNLFWEYISGKLLAVQNMNYISTLYIFLK